MIVDRCPAFRASPPFPVTTALPASADLQLCPFDKRLSHAGSSFTLHQGLVHLTNVYASQLSAHQPANPSLAFLVPALTGHRRRPIPHPTSTAMEAIFNPLGFATPEYYPPQATVSLAETTFMPSPESSVQGDDDNKSHQPPTKKRKSWGQELPIPKTSLPPRYVDQQLAATGQLLTLVSENEQKQKMRRSNAASSEFSAIAKPPSHQGSGNDKRSRSSRARRCQSRSKT